MVLETIFEVPDDENVRGVLRHMFFAGVRTAIELGEDWQQKIHEIWPIAARHRPKANKEKER